ncbi:MAG TPA: carboxypeptidase regulatory-like domain-containing protein [Pirellulaceae bacterium]|nr:carboxypeptidase regulatory-like domain-containing protein [Pirellulaceae bacterium]
MTLISKTRWLSLTALLGAILVTGCGPSKEPTGTVSGTVTLDGEPVESGQVDFVSSEGFAATGSITNGQFTLDASLPVGKYSVGVGPPALTEAPGEEGGDAAVPESPVPASYHTPGTSGLSEDIQEGENSVTIKLTTSGSPAGDAAESAP